VRWLGALRRQSTPVLAPVAAIGNVLLPVGLLVVAGFVPQDPCATSVSKTVGPRESEQHGGPRENRGRGAEPCEGTATAVFEQGHRGNSSDEQRQWQRGIQEPSALERRAACGQARQHVGGAVAQDGGVAQRGVEVEEHGDASDGAERERTRPLEVPSDHVALTTSSRRSASG
jgi:hypothetical protein